MSVVEALMPVVAAGCLGGTILLARINGRILAYHARPAVWAVVGLSAVGGAVAPGSPTAVGPLDVILRAGFAGCCALAATRARRWTWMAASAIAAIGSLHDAYAALAFAALGVSAGSLLVGRRARGTVLGAIVGACIAQSLLRLSISGVFGLSAGLAAIALVLLAWSGLREAHRIERRRVRWGITTLGLLVIAAGALTGVSVLLARSAVQAGVRDAQAGVDAAQAGQAAKAATELSASATQLASAHRKLAAWWAWPGRLLPVVSQNQRALLDLTAQGSRVAVSATSLAQAATNVTSGEVPGQIPLGRLVALRPELSSSQQRVEHALGTIKATRSPWLVWLLADKVNQLTGQLGAVANEEGTLSVGAKVLPALLGSTTPQRYLVIANDPAELRGTGGIIGDESVFVADHGQFSLSPIHQTPSPQASAPLQIPPQTAAWGRSEGFDLASFPVDYTFAPDFPTDARLLEETSTQLGLGSVNGVISVDPAGLASLLQLTGPVAVPGWPVPLSSANAESILLHQQYELLQGDARQQFLSTATQSIFQRLASSHLPGPNALADALGPAVRAGHILVYTDNPEGQLLFSRLGATGAMPALRGADGLEVVTQDAQANKIDWYLRRSITDDVGYDPATGQVRATVTIKLDNTAPTTGEPDYIIANPGSNLPPGTSQLLLTLYSPLRFAGLSEGGKALGIASDRVMGRNAYSTFVTIPSKGQVSLVFRLSGVLDSSATYRLRVGHQLTVTPDQLHVDVRSGSSSWRVDSARGVGISGAVARLDRPMTTERQLSVSFSH